MSAQAEFAAAQLARENRTTRILMLMRQSAQGQRTVTAALPLRC